jgi:hypothetical protein
MLRLSLSMRVEPFENIGQDLFPFRLAQDLVVEARVELERLPA